MLQKQFAIFISIAFFVTTAFVSGYSQEKPAEIKDRRVTIKMVKKPLFDVFAHLISEYDVAIGFEESKLDINHNDYHFETNIPYDEATTPTVDGTRRLLSGLRPTIEHHLITVSFENARLEDVMKDIVKQMRNYDWQINDGVVNIFPRRGRDSRFEELLKLRIREFVVEKDMTVGDIQPLIILFLPEFKAFLAENSLGVDSVRIAPSFIDRILPVGMKFSDLTFRELLNAVTKSKRGGWILRTSKHIKNQDKESIDILI